MKIKDDVKNIITGTYKTYHRAWLFSLFLIIYFFSPVPALAWTETFDGPAIPDGWVISNGGWTFTGTLQPTIVNSEIYRSYTSATYFEFDIILKDAAGTHSSATETYIDFWRNSGADLCGIKIAYGSGSIIPFSDGACGAPVFTAYVYPVFPSGEQHKYNSKIYLTPPSTARWILTNITSGNNTVVKDETTLWSYGLITPTRFFITGNQPVSYFSLDNVIVSTVPSSTSNSVTWSADDYLEGGSQTFSWAVTDSIWSNILPIKIKIYKNGEASNVFSSCVFGICSDTNSMVLYSQSGSMPLHLTSGQYRADLVETGLFSDTVLSTDSMRVLATAPSQMQVNSSIPSRVAFNIWHSVGYSYAAGQIRINVEHKRNGVWELESATQITTSPGETPITVFDIGEYRFTLKDVFQGVNLVVKEATANAVDLPIQVNISTSSLGIDKASYYYRDIMQGYYAVDNNNWSNGNTPYLAIRNTTSNLITAVFKTKIGTEQQNNFMLVVGDGNELASNKFRPGNNSIELRASNTSGDRLLNLTFFNLLDTDVDGNKLRTDKYRYCPSEQVLILASIPLQGNLTIASYKNIGVILYSQSVNGTDQSIIWKTSTIGDYLIRLMDTSGKQLRAADIVISSDCGTPTPTTTISPGTGIVAAQEAADLLSSKIFWAFLIIMGVMMFIATKTKEYIPAGIAGITGLGIFTFIGWVPAWIFFTVLVVTAYLLAKQQTKGEG